MLRKMVRIGRLFDLYGPLLTGRQQDFIRLYHYHDLSLGEIAAQYGITRQAVYDTIRRSEKSLEEYEEKLGFYGRLYSLQTCVDEFRMEINSFLKDVDSGSQTEKKQLLKRLEELSARLEGQKD